MEEIIPMVWKDSFTWLGTAPGSWMRTKPGMTAVPSTSLEIDLKVLMDHGGSEKHTPMLNMLHGFLRTKSYINIMYTEACAECLSNGPKLFSPTEEQWESMEQVAIHLPIADIKAPFPAMIVTIPEGCRRRLMVEFSISEDRMPRVVMARYRGVPDHNPYILLMSKFGHNELFHVMQDQPGNADIEEALQRKIVPNEWTNDAHEFDMRDKESEYPCSVTLSRTVINLLLMLTHYGCKLSEQPTARNRAERRAQATAPCEVRLTQHVVVRRGRFDAPYAEATGGTVCPHWRRGHWRAKRGHGLARAQGQTVPLEFVRPCPVNFDKGPMPMESRYEVRD